MNTLTQRTGLCTRLVNILTFVDLPIRKKFIVFSGGVLFWFLAMFLMITAALLLVNNKSARIENLVSQNRIAQKIVGTMHVVRTDALEVLNAQDADSLTRIVAIARMRLKNAGLFVSVLGTGGTVDDYSTEGARTAGNAISVRSDLATEDYARQMTPLVAEISKKFDLIAEQKSAQLRRGSGERTTVEDYPSDFRALVSRAIAASNALSAQVNQSTVDTTDEISQAVMHTAIAVGSVLLLVAILQVVFTRWIANSIANPVGSIIDQIHALGKGNMDTFNKISVNSSDDIGLLSAEFNGLMDSIHKMTMFKKVIEEDDAIEDVYSRLGAVFKEQIGIEEYMIFDVVSDQNKMKPAYPIPLSEREICCNRDILESSNLCKAKKTGHTISSMAYPRMCKMFQRETEKEHVCVPMIVGGNAGGVVQFLFDKPTPGSNAARLIERKTFKATQYIRESQAVIEAKRLTSTLRDSALKDALTGLYNRRFLQEHTEKFAAGVMRRSKCAGLVMCDLDFFKQVNDAYGHNAGDAVLKETAKVIAESVRSADLVIRFGGEEFLVVLLDINEGDSTLVAEKIRDNVQKAKIRVHDAVIQKTISIGISEFPVDTEMFWQAIKFADVALYKAKEGGRNKVVRFSREMWSEKEF